jgi:hypothetical protein
MTDLAQFTADLMQNRTDLQPGLFRLGLPSTCSVIGRHLVNKNQDGIAKLDINIEQDGSDGGGGWMSVADFFDW